MNEKLITIQQTLKAPKSQYNNFGGYSYRSCEDILEAVKPILSYLGLSLKLQDELLQIGDRYYVKATAYLTDGKDVITNTAYAREEETKKGMDGSQITGASSSYARKYALNGLFLIDDVKDSDATNTGKDITLEDAQKYEFTTGKHKGEKLVDLIKSEDSYIEWILTTEEGKYEDIKKMITLLTGQVAPTEDQKKERLKMYKDLNDLFNARDIDRDSFYGNHGVKTMKEFTDIELANAIQELKEVQPYAVTNDEYNWRE